MLQLCSMLWMNGKDDVMMHVIALWIANGNEICIYFWLRPFSMMGVNSSINHASKNVYTSILDDFDGFLTCLTVKILSKYQPFQMSHPFFAKDQSVEREK